MPAFRHRHSLSLEVATESLHADLEIISPTPRAFTFPINSQDRPPLPYAVSTTPLHFGVERDLHPSTPGPHRGWSPSPSESSSATFSSRSTFSTSSFSSSPATPASASGRRRKSSAISLSSDASSSVRPKKGDDDYVKRPENAFILFRRKCCEERISSVKSEDCPAGLKKKQRQADLSKTISQQWKELSLEEKQEWENLAKEKKREHEKAHPGYVYRPQRKVNKRELKKDGTEDLDGSGSFMVQINPPALPRVSRSAMGPTPPPFQSVLHLSNDRSPTSPGFIPQIAKRPSRSDLSPDLAQYEFESHGTTFVQPSGLSAENATFGAAPFEERPFFAGRARSQSLHLTMPSYDMQPHHQQQQLLPSANVLSPASDSSPSPVSPTEALSYSPETSSPYTPLEAITGPFSQFGMSSSYEQNPSSVWNFSQPTFEAPSPQEEQRHPLDAMPYQPITTWEDVSLWEGDERFEISTALCEIGLPPSLDEEDMPLGAEFMNPTGCQEPVFDYVEEDRFTSEYALPPTFDANSTYVQYDAPVHDQYPTYEFIPYLASP